MHIMTPNSSEQWKQSSPSHLITNSVEQLWLRESLHRPITFYSTEANNGDIPASFSYTLKHWTSTPMCLLSNHSWAQPHRAAGLHHSKVNCQHPAPRFNNLIVSSPFTLLMHLKCVGCKRVYWQMQTTRVPAAVRPRKTRKLRNGCFRLTEAKRLC